MSKLVIEGGKKLQGEVDVAGAKNAALPILAATLLTNKPVILQNVPFLQDVSTMLELTGGMGASFLRNADHSISVDCTHITRYEAPDNLVRSMRASILVLGPLLSRFRTAKVSLPGGCAIGARPVNLHIKGMQQLGATVRVENGYIFASCEQGLHGAEIIFDTVTVTGTENIMMAAVLATGQTIIRNAAQEPEVADLANFLNSMGAKIQGIGTKTIIIDGVKELTGSTYRVMPDRIEAGTLLAAAACTRGHVTLNNIDPSILESVLDKFREVGADITCTANSITLDMQGRRPRAVSFATAPYPDFPTDMQAQLMAVNAVAEGAATVVETIFENRFMHAQELMRMGAEIIVQDNTARINGIDYLRGARVNATDLRASAGLIVAALMAKGTTEVANIHHLDRGYEALEQKLQKLGANIKREESYETSATEEEQGDGGGDSVPASVDNGLRAIG